MYTGFICGGFTTTVEPTSLETIDSRWQRVKKSFSERAAGHRMYVPAFYDFCYHTGNDRNTGLRRYRLNVDADITMPVSGTDRSLPVHIGEVEFSFAPFSVAIFSARFDIDTDNIDDLITVVNKLRYVSLYASDSSLDEFRKLAITPILKVYGDTYKVQCGVYRIRDNAVQQMQKLKASGFDAIIVNTTSQDVHIKQDVSLDEVAKLVIQGVYGNGVVRKQKLEAEGYNYQEVQKRVNALIKS